MHRLQQAIGQRGRHPESWLWETEDGRQWLIRLVVATLYTFGLKRGVGLETISAFCVRLRLETQVWVFAVGFTQQPHADVGGNHRADDGRVGTGWAPQARCARSLEPYTKPFSSA